MSFLFTLARSAEIAVVCFGLALASSAQADSLIDDFTAGSMGILSGAGSFAQAVNGVLGGERDLNYDFSSPLPGNELALISSAPGYLVSTTANLPGLDSTAKSFTLTYDGVGGAGVNVNLTTASAIVVQAYTDAWTTPAGPGQLSLALTDNLGVTRTLSLTPNTTPFVFGEILFNLADPAFSGLNESDVERISLSYKSAQSADTFFDSIAIRSLTTNNVAMPIPESDSYALMFAGFGLVGLLARRRS